jgi:hypothetical protein
MRLQQIILKNGQEVIINHDSKTKCKACGKDIFWCKTMNGEKAMPVELVGLAVWDTHFATCPQANSFRRKPTKQELEEIHK